MKAPCRIAVAAVVLACTGTALAAPDAATQREIDVLMSALQGSHCRFQRNGSWYGEREARAHLQRKYDYLSKRNMIGSTEQFIERAASRSSMSGKPYRIACPGSPEQDASRWFGERLKQLRHPQR